MKKRMCSLFGICTGKISLQFFSWGSLRSEARGPPPKQIIDVTFPILIGVPIGTCHNSVTSTLIIPLNYGLYMNENVIEM